MIVELWLESQCSTPGSSLRLYCCKDMGIQRFPNHITRKSKPKPIYIWMWGPELPDKSKPQRSFPYSYLSRISWQLFSFFFNWFISATTCSFSVSSSLHRQTNHVRSSTSVKNHHPSKTWMCTCYLRSLAPLWHLTFEVALLGLWGFPVLRERGKKLLKKSHKHLLCSHCP